MTCLTCQHWQPKKSGEMAKHGYAICDKSEPYKFFAPSHAACQKLEPVPDKALKDRQGWVAKMDERHTKGKSQK